MIFKISDKHIYRNKIDNFDIITAKNLIINELKKELKDLMVHYQDLEALAIWNTTESKMQDMPK